MSLIIRKALSSDFEQNLFEASEKSLNDKSNPLRLNNYSSAIRELTRHILDRLSPKKNVTSCSWFIPNKDNIITRKQKAYYAVQGGLSDTYVKNELGLEVDDMHKELIAAIKILNKFTHIQPEVFGLSNNLVDKHVSDITCAFNEFFLSIFRCRESIIERLSEKIDSTIFNEVIFETIQSIDSLATHHFIEEVYTDEVEVREINHDTIVFHAKGSISSELQWGSNSDVRHDNGLEFTQSFPFECGLISPTNEPEDIKVIKNSLTIDISSWSDCGSDPYEQI